MTFKNRSLQNIKKELEKYNLDKELIDRIVLYSDDNWIEQLIIRLSKCENEAEALQETLQLFLIKNFDNTPKYVNKDKALQLFPISKRKFEDLTRNRLIPTYQISTKNRLYSVDELYKYFEDLKVDSIVNRVHPIQLQTFIQKAAAN